MVLEETAEDWEKERDIQNERDQRGEIRFLKARTLRLQNSHTARLRSQCDPRPGCLKFLLPRLTGALRHDPLRWAGDRRWDDYEQK